MDDWFRDKLEKLDGRLDKIDISQTEIKKDLKYHIKRTDLLEKHIGSIDDKVTPLTTKYQELIGIGKFLAALALVFGLAESFPKLLKILTGFL